jgi:hypothetical protein
MNERKVMEVSTRFVDELNETVVSKSPIPFTKGLTEGERIYFAQMLTYLVKVALEPSDHDLRDYNR